MANFAPSRAADAPGFTDRKVREIVVEDKFLFAGAAGVGIKFLRVFTGAQCTQRERLGLAALKQGRTMSARQNTYLTVNRPHGFKIPTVQAFAPVP